jgi:hypothetical protein
VVAERVAFALENFCGKKKRNDCVYWAVRLSMNRADLRTIDRTIAILLAYGLLFSGCASDSGDNDQPRHHHHHRDRTEGVDRSDRSSPSPSPGF